MPFYYNDTDELVPENIVEESTLGKVVRNTLKTPANLISTLGGIPGYLQEGYEIDKAKQKEDFGPDEGEAGESYMDTAKRLFRTGSMDSLLAPLQQQSTLKDMQFPTPEQIRENLPLPQYLKESKPGDENYETASVLSPMVLGGGLGLGAMATGAGEAVGGLLGSKVGSRVGRYIGEKVDAPETFERALSLFGFGWGAKKTAKKISNFKNRATKTLPPFVEEAELESVKAREIVDADIRGAKRSNAQESADLTLKKITDKGDLLRKRNSNAETTATSAVDLVDTAEKMLKDDLETTEILYTESDTILDNLPVEERMFDTKKIERSIASIEDDIQSGVPDDEMAKILNQMQKTRNRYVDNRLDLRRALTNVKNLNDQLYNKQLSPGYKTYITKFRNSLAEAISNKAGEFPDFNEKWLEAKASYKRTLEYPEMIDRYAKDADRAITKSDAARKVLEDHGINEEVAKGQHKNKMDEYDIAERERVAGKAKKPKADAADVNQKLIDNIKRIEKKGVTGMLVNIALKALGAKDWVRQLISLTVFEISGGKNYVKEVFKEHPELKKPWQDSIKLAEKGQATPFINILNYVENILRNKDA